MTIESPNLEVERTCCGAGDAHERGLDRIGDALFDLRDGEAWRLRDDDDLIVRQVGERLDRQIAQGEDAGDDERGEAEQHEQALPERRAHEAFDQTLSHGYCPSGCFSISDLMRNAPDTAISSSSSAPLMISTKPSTAGPTMIGRLR